MTIYILIYSLLLVLIFFDTKKQKASKKQILLFEIFILLLFRGLRWDIGTDWDQYLQVFQQTNWDNIFTYKRATGESMEFGYVILNVLVKSLGFNYSAFLFVTNAFILFSYYKFTLKFSDKHPIAVFNAILFSVNFFPVRQDLSIAVLLFAYDYLIKNDLKKVIVIVAAACLIHNASFVFLLLYPFRKINWTLKKMTIVLVVAYLGAAVAQSMIHFLLTNEQYIPAPIYIKIRAYSVAQADTGMAGKGLANLILSFILCYFSAYYSCSIKNGVNKRIVNILLTTTVLMYCMQFLFVGDLVVFARLAVVFSVAFNVLYVEGIYLYFYKLRMKNPWLTIHPEFVIAAYLMFRFSRMIQLYPEMHFPYHLVF